MFDVLALPMDDSRPSDLITDHRSLITSPFIFQVSGLIFHLHLIPHHVYIRVYPCPSAFAQKLRRDTSVVKPSPFQISNFKFQLSLISSLASRISYLEFV